MKEIYAIEVTSKCNLSCDWCPHRNMRRAKEHMSMIDYERSIKLCKELRQNTIILNNIGEPLLHPHIEEMVFLASTNGLETVFSTNGVLLNSWTAQKLKEAGLTLLILSEQILDITLSCVEICTAIDLPYSVNAHKNLTWAGQHDHKRANQHETGTDGCEFFIKSDRVVIFSDGSIGTCCVDYENTGKLGTIWDDNWFKLSPNPLPICEKCHNR